MLPAIRAPTSHVAAVIISSMLHATRLVIGRCKRVRAIIPFVL